MSALKNTWARKAGTNGRRPSDEAEDAASDDGGDQAAGARRRLRVLRGPGDGVEPPKRTGLATLIRNATRRLEDLERRKVGGSGG
jgi:hypothetical protein